MKSINYFQDFVQKEKEISLIKLSKSFADIFLITAWYWLIRTPELSPALPYSNQLNRKRQLFGLRQTEKIESEQTLLLSNTYVQHGRMDNQAAFRHIRRINNHVFPTFFIFSSEGRRYPAEARDKLLGYASALQTYEVSEIKFYEKTQSLVDLKPI